MKNFKTIIPRVENPDFDKVNLESEFKFFKDNIYIWSANKQASSVVPTYKPKNFFEQFYFYNSGVTYRLYVYINNIWKYVALT
uniref:Uncharacterized protein n=1 Tax=viral metagenome TaxID=1070528 RepID=A0A6M3XK95_9ZZZZ